MRVLNVLILTQDNCGFCEDATILFERLARDFPLSVATLEVDSPEGQMLAAQGGVMFPPGIFIEEEPFCYGRPSERKIRREIERRLLSRASVP